MKVAVVTALLVASALAVPASADTLSDRFRDDFGDPPDAAPTAAIAAPGPGVITLPRRRLPPPKPHAVHADDPALPLVAAPATGVAASPAARAINRPGATPNQYEVGISWNALDPSWDGMFLTNKGDKPFVLRGIELNGRKDCALKPYSLSKIRSLVDLTKAIREWGRQAVNLFGLPKMETDAVLAPDLPSDLQSPALGPEVPKVGAGGRIPIFNGTKCDSVVSAVVDTDAGPVAVKFAQPYEGH